MLWRLLTIVLLAAAFAAPAAQAASVSYLDGNDVWVASPDGTLKLQLTQSGTVERPWLQPVQTSDGRTLAAHREPAGETTRPWLYLFGSGGQQLTSQVMPAYDEAVAPVYPLEMDVDWNGNAVAYSYLYCSEACKSTFEGYWLTLTTGPGPTPDNPPGQSEAFNPTFFGTRVVSVDSGGSVFVQSDVPEAPFTSSYELWLPAEDVDAGAARLTYSRAIAASSGELVALEYSIASKDTGEPLEEGVLVGRRTGNLPSPVVDTCQLPAQGIARDVSFSPDGTQIAWRDAGGVKAAGVPNLGAGTDTCALLTPPVTISATGSEPDFGGATLTAPGGGSMPTPPGGAPTNPIAFGVKAPKRVSPSAFARGVKLRVSVPSAGLVKATAKIPPRIAKRADPDIRAKVASARVKATAPGTWIVKLKPTRAAKQQVKQLKGAKLSVRVTHGDRSAKVTIKVT